MGPYPNIKNSSLMHYVTCDLGGYKSLDGYYLTQDMVQMQSFEYLFKNCNYSIFLFISQSGAKELYKHPEDLRVLVKALVDGFDLSLIVNNTACDSCKGSNGVCGYDFGLNKFKCHCDDQDYDIQCGVNSLAGVSMGVVVLLALLGGCLLIIKKSKRNPQKQSVEDSLMNYASLVPKRYAYKYIKKITRSFREKLGEGGYGTVFKGNLKDGRIVAVKVWKQSKGDGQDFLNEVMSISRTSHVNVVPLLGFCFEGHKRALIYEFMPNGSLEKFIQGRYLSENTQPLSAQKMFEIGVGVARGLEYLHRGCNTRIVHFDIKPHNILLDAEFVPKISDFGLAKSCQQKESLISMSGARGTVGYIAPEVFFRMYGGVSHKSDVYSFGMMVLEMVGCKKKDNDNVENSSETYFPQWIYNQLELGTITIDCERILTEEEKELERKMLLVGLWCIQTNPRNRPSMSRVVDMLEGKVELLEVPPMPTLWSPPRQQKQR
ncbi:hypothetical protein V2J09_012651 [Rumex salicifolius]